MPIYHRRFSIAQLISADVCRFGGSFELGDILPYCSLSHFTPNIKIPQPLRLRPEYLDNSHTIETWRKPSFFLFLLVGSDCILQLAAPGHQLLENKKQVKGAVHQSSGMPLTCFFYMIFYNQAVEMQTLLTAPIDRP